MYERDLNNRSNNDAVVTIPSPAEGQGERTDTFRSRVTRDGTVSLEIEIPRLGVTNTERLFMSFFLMIAFVFFLLGVPLVPMLILMDGVSGLWFLLFLVVPTLIILSVPSSIRSSSFTHTHLKITRNNYCLIQRGITWKSFLQIMFAPSHFNDLESRQFVETDPTESEYVRRAGLRAEIVTHHHEHSESRDIKLGSISIAHGLSDGELAWLTEEINRFLRET